MSFFGTDGVRAKVGEAPMIPEVVMKLGWAAGQAIKQHSGMNRPVVLIGKDTRISGYMLESALEAGFSAAGVDVRLLGPMPTPAIAYLTQTFNAQAGVVISASHNPYYDNGIKFFDGQGQKISADMEGLIETLMAQDMTTVPSQELGKAKRIDDAAGRYIEFCKSTFRDSTGQRLELSGMKLIVDCANGATYHIAPAVFSELGAEVISIGVDPDGLNINLECGATSTKKIQQKVIEHEADLGIALDGDGDRLILVDSSGQVVDGDQILYLLATYWNKEARLQGGVAGTLMTNLGVENALKAKGVSFVRTAVGDKYLMRALVENNWCLGAEGSGHILCMDRIKTGDGIVAALQVLEALIVQKQTLKSVLEELRLYPQVLINVRVVNRDVIDNDDIKVLIQESEDLLGEKGRILVRASGTEPLIRVMAEGLDKEEITKVAKKIANKIELIGC